MESIISATISALATIIAAWLNNRQPSPAANTPTAPPQSTQTETKSREGTNSDPATNKLWWAIVLGGLFLLLMFAGFIIHWDLPSIIGLFAIPLALIILALTKPIKPWIAVVFVCGISTVAFFSEFLVKLSMGASIQLSGSAQGLPWWILLITGGYALLAFTLCWWKLK